MLSDKILIIQRRKITDSRGWLVKPITGDEIGLPQYTGEIYVTLASPGQSKGGDYSISTNKWFTVIDGKAILKLEDIETKEKLELELDGSNPKTILVPSNIANLFVNNGDKDFIVLAYADQKYNKTDIVAYNL